MKRKWQRILSWVLTLTMLVGTFQGTGLTVRAAGGWSGGPAPAEVAWDDSSSFTYTYTDTNKGNATVGWDLKCFETAEREESITNAFLAVGGSSNVQFSTEGVANCVLNYTAPAKSTINREYIGKTLYYSLVATDGTTDNAISDPIDFAITLKAEEGDLYGVDVTDEAFSTAQGEWNPESDTLVLVKGTAVPALTLGAWLFDSTGLAAEANPADPSDLTYDISWSIVSGGTDKHVGINSTTGQLYMVGGVDDVIPDTAETTPIVVKATQAGTFLEDTFTINVQYSSDQFMNVIATTEVETGDTEWTTESATEGNILTVIDGTTLEKAVNFKATRGGFAAAVTDIHWYLAEKSERDAIHENPQGEVAAGAELIGDTSVNLNGLIFSRNADGTITIQGTPNETLATEDGNDNPVDFYLMARSDRSGATTFADRWGEYKINILIDYLQPSLQYVDKKAQAADPTLQPTKVVKADGSYIKADAITNPVLEFEVASPNYTVEKSDNVNAIDPIELVFSNASTTVNLDDLSFAIEQRDLEKDHTDKFVLSGEVTALAAGQTDKKTLTVNVATGIEASPNPYEAFLVAYGKQMPETGAIVAKLSFSVNPAFEMKVNGERKELKPINEDALYAGSKAGYVFEIGTYTANTQVVGGINLTVSSVEADKTASFVGSTDDPLATKTAMLPTGLAVAAANASSMSFTGYLDPDTWVNDNNENLNHTTFAKPYCVYDDMTGEVVYTIPFVVKDGVVGQPDRVPNKVYYYGELRVKPAEIIIEADDLANEGNNYALNLTGTAGMPRASRAVEFSVTNPGYKAITVYLDERDNTIATGNGFIIAEFNADGTVKPVTLAAPLTVPSLQLAAGETKTFIVAPKGNEGRLDVDTAEDIWVYRVIAENGEYSTPANEIAINKKTISMSIKVVAEGDIQILEPTDGSGDNYTGTLLTEVALADTANHDVIEEKIEEPNPDTYPRELEVGIGEKAEFVFKAEGSTNPINYVLIPEDELWKNADKGTKNEYAFVTNYLSKEENVKYVSATSELAADGFNFKFIDGVLSTTGATEAAKDKSFVIGVYAFAAGEDPISVEDSTPANTADTARVFYKITVGKTDKAIKVYDGDKLLRATMGDTDKFDQFYYDKDPVHKTDYEKISDTRNLLMETTRDSIDPVSKEITIKNEGFFDMDKVKVAIGNGVKLVAPDEDDTANGTLPNDSTNPFVLHYGADVIEIGMIKAGESATFTVDVKATHFNDVEPGSYLVPVTITGDMMRKQTFYVKLVVKADTPILEALNKRANAAWDATAIANAGELPLYHQTPATPDPSRGVDRTIGHPFTRDVVNTYYGNQIKIGKEVDLQLLAWNYDHTTLLKKGKVRFDWAETLAGDPSIEDLGLTMDTDGHITGTISKAGTYYITVKIQDITDSTHVMTGYADICFVVPGNVPATVKISEKNVETDAEAVQYLFFKGAVQGDEIDSSFNKEFEFRNGSNDAEITGIKVTFSDDTSDADYAGSASHFKATVEKTSLEAGTNRTSKIVITPDGTASAGVYRAIVHVKSDQTYPIEFPVTWIVAKKLTVTPPGGEQTEGRTGQNPNFEDTQYEVVLNANGAGILFDADGVLQNNDIDYYNGYLDLQPGSGYEYALPVTAVQGVTWSVSVKNDDLDDNKLIALAKAFNELGINTGNVDSAERTQKYGKYTAENINQFNVTADADIKDKIKDHKIAIAQSNYAGNSRYNVLTSADLTGGGTYQFSAVAEVPEVKLDGTVKTVVIPKQSAEMDITIRIEPSTDVYISAADTNADGVNDDDDYEGISQFTKVLEHETLVGEDRLVNTYWKVTGFDFRDLAVGYADDTYYRDFVLKNEVSSDLKYTIKTLSANKTDASDAFLLYTDAEIEADKAFDDPTAVKLEGTIENSDKTGNPVQGFYGFNLCLKNDLPVGEYSGWLVIEGSGFETIEIPLTASVSPKNYSITIRDYDLDTKTYGETDTFDCNPKEIVKANNAPIEVGSAYIFVNGNQPLKVLRVAELKDGEELGEGAQTKLQVGFGNPPLANGSVTLNPAHNVEVPVTLDDHALFTFYVLDNKTPSANSVQMRIWYEDKNTVTQENYKDITVNYVLYDDEIDDTVTITPEQESPYNVMGNTKEGYNVDENSIEFTLSVSGEPNPAEALYGLNVSVDLDDTFVVKGKVPYAVMPGESVKFVIAPKEGLPRGSYRPVVTFVADNLKPIRRELYFDVEKNETFTTYAVADDTGWEKSKNFTGWTVESGFKDRLEDALNDLASIDSATFKVVGTSLVDGKGYKINLNDKDPVNGLDIQVISKGGVLTVVKLPTCDVNQFETKLENTKYVEGDESFHFVSFKVLEIVDLRFTSVWNDLTKAEDGGVIVDGVDLGPANGPVFEKWMSDLTGENWVFDDVHVDEGTQLVVDPSPVFRFLVPFGQAFNTATEMSSYLNKASGLPYMNISLYTRDRSFEGFLYNPSKASLSVLTLEGGTNITDDVQANASWHEHTYAKPKDSLRYEGDGEGVKWTWVGDKENGYTEAYVTLTCVNPKCPDEKKGEKVLTAVVTPEKKAGSCTKGGYWLYHASVTYDATKGIGFNNVTYVSENIAREEGTVDRHQWVYDWTETGVIAYNLDDRNGAYATVKANCVSSNHIVELDGPADKTVSCDKVEFYGIEPTCEAPGSGYFHFIFLSPDIPAEDIEKGLNVVSRNAAELAPLGHKWKVDSTDWEGNYETGATGATMHIVCENDSTHKADLVITKENIDLVSISENGAKTYRAVGNKDGQTLTAEITYTSVPDHEHNWTVSFNWISVSINKADTKVEAVAYCKVGGEIVPVEVTLTDKMVGTTIEYTAEAKDPNGKVYYSYKNVSKDGVVRDGHAGQVLNGDLVIVGLEEEYPYTGKKITPDFYVMDGDVVLAKGGDYSVKFSNNKNVGEATIEISGKGNYKDKNAVAKFKIYDPFQKAKDEGVSLAAGVKSIAKIQGSFVYNGKAQYPATITVNLNTKPKSSLTLTHDGDGVYTNEGDTTVVISVVNNVNKGTAVVAAVGADGKVKTKTFSIKAAEISSAKVIEGLEAEYSSKGAIPAGLEVNWKNVDEEEVDLIAKQDFTVKYSNNKAVGTGKIKLTGKGNFKGKLESSFAIKPLEVDEIDAVEAFDKVKAGKLKVTVLDKQGFKVPDKKLSVTVLNEEGTAIDGKTKLTAGTKITVVVKSADPASVVIAEDGISKDAVVGTKMGSVKVDAKKLTKTYTGEAIELTEEDMGSVIVTYKKTPLVYGEDFVIVGHANNVNKGSMTVTIAGTGEDNGRGVFSGTKTFKVKIVAKSMQ